MDHANLARKLEQAIHGMEWMLVLAAIAGAYYLLVCVLMHFALERPARRRREELLAWSHTWTGDDS